MSGCWDDKDPPGDGWGPDFNEKKDHHGYYDDDNHIKGTKARKKDRRK